MKNWRKIVGILSLFLILALGLAFLFNIGTTPSERVNILLLGVDARVPGQAGNTDSISVLSVDKKTQEISLLSIPRDTRVEISGIGTDKINHAYPQGGIDTTVETVENFLDIKIDYYVLVNFDQFKEIVDTVGGINMEVEPHVAAAVPELSGKDGQSRLNGEEALAYVRFRFDDEGDPGRVKRHQRAIQAIIKEALNPANIMDVPAIFNHVMKNVKTNVPPLETTVINMLISGIDLENAQTAMVQGEWARINGIAYLIPDMDKTEAMVVDLSLRA